MRTEEGDGERGGGKSRSEQEQEEEEEEEGGEEGGQGSADISNGAAEVGDLSSGDVSHDEKEVMRNTSTVDAG
jgi:hypothetical protein